MFSTESTRVYVAVGSTISRAGWEPPAYRPRRRPGSLAEAVERSLHGIVAAARTDERAALDAAAAAKGDARAATRAVRARVEIKQ